MKRRGYRGPIDIDALQAFTAAANGSHGYVGYLHVGDVPHRLFNGLRTYDVADLLHIWEDDRGEIAAWACIYPRHPGFDLQVRPDIRTPALEEELIRWLVPEAWRRLDAAGIEENELVIDGYEGDEIRARAAAAAGFTAGPEFYVVSARSLATVPPVVLPPGYYVRAASGVEEAAALADVHSGSFGSEWTSELYAWVMTSPGYDPSRELVAVAPDGGLAAFTVTWHDHRNGTGLFEPVGTHADHRRLGLGSAVMASGMQRMAKAGLTRALVMYEEANEASKALYQGMGFRALVRIVDWTLPR